MTAGKQLILVYQDDIKIDLTDEESEYNITESVHQYIMKEYPPDRFYSGYEYEIDFDQKLSRLDLTFPKVTFTIEPEGLHQKEQQKVACQKN